MTVRPLALLAALLAAFCLPGVAHAAGNGDLEPVQCIQSPPTPPSTVDRGCISVGIPVGGAPVEAPGGADVYSFTSGVVARYARASDGSLSLVGCIGQVGTTTCPTTAPGLIGAGTTVTSSAVLTPDGTSLYVLAENGSAASSLTQFHRAADGSLTFGMCIATPAQAGCATDARIGALYNAVVSPNGKSLYVGGTALLHYTIAADGSLTTVAGDCVTTGSATGCTFNTPDGGYDALALSPGATDLYTGTGHSLRRFTLNASTGAFVSYAGCLGYSSFFNCTTPFTQYGGGQFAGLVATADGKSVYATNPFGSASDLEVLPRAGDGSLTVSAGQCWLVTDSPVASTCQRAYGLDNERGAVASSDSAWLYTYGDGVTIFQRNADGSLTRIRCIESPAAAVNCTQGAPGLTHFGEAQVTISPSGTSLYAGDFSRFEVFRRVTYVAPPALDTRPLDESSAIPELRAAQRAGYAPADPAASVAASPAARKAVRPAPRPKARHRRHRIKHRAPLRRRRLMRGRFVR
jgi:hypothetical protein